jgi:hypothetical protein
MAQALSPDIRPGVRRLLAAFLDPAENDLHEDWEQARAARTRRRHPEPEPRADQESRRIWRRTTVPPGPLRSSTRSQSW